MSSEPYNHRDIVRDVWHFDGNQTRKPPASAIRKYDAHAQAMRRKAHPPAHTYESEALCLLIFKNACALFVSSLL